MKTMGPTGTTVLCLLAQMAPPGDSPIPWLSIIIQGGAFALVCYIVCVMWPKSRKDDREERERRDLRNDLRDDKFVKVIDLIQAAFSERNTKVVEALERQTVKLTQVLQHTASKIEEVVKHKNGGEA